MTEREQFMKWLDTCPFEREHMYEDTGKHYTKVRVLFSFSSSDEDWDDFKVGMTCSDD